MTNREYLFFLNDLVLQGKEEEALQWVPRERAGQAGQLGSMIYGRRKDGSFKLVADADGDLWELDYPVLMVNWHCAMAYAQWEAERTRYSWRLPFDLEWAKAARGVDGRFYPWGDGFNPSFTCMRQSHKGRALPVVVDSYPVDESVYGIRGMAGNSIDWTASVWKAEGQNIENGRIVEIPDLSSVGSYRIYRGGSWINEAQFLRVSSRGYIGPSLRYDDRGVRLSRSINGVVA